MCTAISYLSKDHYFGRNLDLEYSFDEKVIVTPRAYPFLFRNGTKLNSHYGMIGIAAISKGYPLYYEATNEKGLSMAGLNFPGNAFYNPFSPKKKNVAPFELIPWILGCCVNTEEAVAQLSDINLWHEAFSQEFPLSPLHWMLSDKHQSITVEPMKNGLRIHKNPAGVLTNNPPFEYQMYHLAQFLNLTSDTPENRFSDKLELERFSLGMGSFGLPGDPSSPSRFVKAAFVKWNSCHEPNESASVNQVFHILNSVAQQKGITHVKNEDYEFTLYSSCCNTDKGIYYYTTYENSFITAVDMYKENLQGSTLVCYPLRKQWQVFREN